MAFVVGFLVGLGGSWAFVHFGPRLVSPASTWPQIVFFPGFFVGLSAHSAGGSLQDWCVWLGLLTMGLTIGVIFQAAAWLWGLAACWRAGDRTGDRTRS